MKPRYSVLFCNQTLEIYKDKIEVWLHMGIKIIWFGTSKDAEKLKSDYAEFAKELLLQVYVVNISNKAVIIDGKGDKDFFDNIEKACPQFNVAQY